VTIPSVSVLVCAYAHEDFIVQALDSVAAQTFRDFELIITDDCSPDATADRIEEWLARTGARATFLRNTTNVGICAVRNRALAVASGRFVCSLAGDDWWESDRLERQHAAFSAMPDNVALVYGDVNVVDSFGRMQGSYLKTVCGRGAPEGRILARLIRRNVLPAAGVMVRRSAIVDVGGYDESLAYEDYDMWLRIAARFEVRHIPGAVSNYRVLATSMSHSRTWRGPIRSSTLRVLSKWITGEPEVARLAASRLRAVSLAVALSDPAAARSALRLVRSFPPRAPWRVAELVLAVVHASMIGTRGR
jgi:glycosyltransferase involved in cell wall biosynthesis